MEISLENLYVDTGAWGLKEMKKWIVTRWDLGKRWRSHLIEDYRLINIGQFYRKKLIYGTLVNDFVKEVTTFKCHTDSFTVVWWVAV